MIPVMVLDQISKKGESYLAASGKTTDMLRVEPINARILEGLAQLQLKSFDTGHYGS